MGDKLQESHMGIAVTGVSTPALYEVDIPEGTTAGETLHITVPGREGLLYVVVPPDARPGIDTLVVDTATLPLDSPRSRRPSLVRKMASVAGSITSIRMLLPGGGEANLTKGRSEEASGIPRLALGSVNQPPAALGQVDEQVHLWLALQMISDREGVGLPGVEVETDNVVSLVRIGSQAYLSGLCAGDQVLAAHPNRTALVSPLPSPLSPHSTHVVSHRPKIPPALPDSGAER